MADLTLCNNHKCPIREDCLRASAIPELEYQNAEEYFYDDKNKNCDHFIERQFPKIEVNELN